MTGIGTKRSRTQKGQAPGSQYLEIFRLPGTRQFSAACFVGRWPMAMVNLGIILVVSASTSSYAIAGAVSATGSLCYAFVSPQMGRLFDRLGQSRVLRPLIVAYSLSTVAFIVCAQARAPLWTLFLAGALFYTSMPPLGSLVRSRWSHLLGDSPLLHTAFSFESVADELIFVTGPALVTILATELVPVSGIAVAGALAVTGMLLLLRLGSTEPPPQSRRHSGSRAISTPGMLVIMAVFAGLGAMFGTIDLSTVAFATEHHHKPLAGLILGTYALGSASGGLWYGARKWRAPLHRRFLITLAGMVMGVAPLWAIPNVPVLFGVIFFCGLSIAPTLIGGFSLIERKMRAGLLTEGMSLLSTAIGLGLAAGPPISGKLIDSHGASWGYLFALGCGSVALAAGLLGARRLGAQPAEVTSGHG
ncbi:MAG TPA: MFS transporter [Streptosporangiaceae bacterium]|nr:MFS transporter [Streptosporangiaceae bacterium]